MDLSPSIRDNPARTAYPRSGRERIGEFMWLLRMFDKARATAAGTAFDYIYPCPIDRGVLEHWGIAVDAFDAAIAAHRDDGAIFAWLRERVTDDAIARANAWLVETKAENLDRQDCEERGGVDYRDGAVCTNCGVGYPPSASAPERCRICDDERVAKPPVQTWTTKGDLLATHASDIRACEPGVLTGIGVAPSFAIGQRAMLVEQSDGCILWDCPAIVDGKVVDYIRARGGLKAIAISHPHFYGAMFDWSRTFDDAPVYIHELDREWIVHAPPGLVLWTGDSLAIAPGATLVRCGGHFDGGAVLHVAAAAAAQGALLTGDVIMVGQHGRGVSFMRSYPGYIPLGRDQVRRVASAIEPFSFTAIYGFSWGRVIRENGAAIVAHTAQRFLDAYAT